MSTDKPKEYEMKTGRIAWRYVAVTALCGMAAWSAVSETVETTPVARMELRARAEIRKRDPGIFGDYWWANRFLNHREQVARLNGRPVDVVLVGDSIMHYWEWRHLAKWSALTNGRTVLNLGYAGDRTQHVLWRIEHGELDGFTAKNVVLMIGTNNNSSDNTDPANVAKAIEEIIARIREKQPGAQIILHPIFPRGASADSKRHAAARARNDRTNVLLKEFATAHPEVTWVDFNDKLVDSTGWVPRTIMADQIHPTDAGYDLWLEALLPHLRDDRVPLADPFILYEKGTYYAYGTHSRVGITVATSTDLVHWKMDQGRSKDGLALHKDDSFGKKFFWAPEVYRVGGRYVMYYSAETHVCAATADNPLGPFRQAEKKPILERGGIDNSLFIDDDGRAWMVLPIQATPKMETIAFMPDANTLPLAALRTSALPTSSIRAAMLIITISMVVFIANGLPLNEGRNSGKMPNNTTSNTPSINASTAHLACGLSAFISSAASSSTFSNPSRTRR